MPHHTAPACGPDPYHMANANPWQAEVSPGHFSERSLARLHDMASVSLHHDKVTQGHFTSPPILPRSLPLSPSLPLPPLSPPSPPGAHLSRPFSPLPLSSSSRPSSSLSSTSEIMSWGSGWLSGLLSVPLKHSVSAASVFSGAGDANVEVNWDSCPTPTDTNGP